MKKLGKLFLLVLGMIAVQEIKAQGKGADSDEVSIQETEDVDINRKSRECKQLTLNAVKHFLKVPLASACNDFIHNAVWRKGEMFVSVFTEDGVCLAQGDDYDFIWQSIKEVKGVGGIPLIKEMLVAGQKGGRMNFLWNNGYQSAYVKQVKKDGVTYVLSSGFYPENDEYATKQLVKTAVTYFLQNGKEATFALISNPKGPFVKGDIYLFVNDFNGVYMAHGSNPVLVGQEAIDLTDSRGKFLMKEILKVAKTKGSGWVDYYWRNEFKRSYVERVIDPKTKIGYAISAGYYPNINLQVVKSYTAKAIRYLKANGSKVAFAEFSNIVGEFAQGGLGVFVLDYNGKCLANGENPAYVGQNLLKIRGDQGRYYYRDMIEEAKKYGKALVSYTNFNANAVAYVERVETPDGKFVIGTEFFPASKSSSTQTLVNRAVSYLKENSYEKAFETFSTRDNVFIRGDLTIFAYDDEGTRLVNGIQKSHVWKNLIKSTDQEGKNIVNDIITVAINGGGWVQYKVRNASRKVYVKAVPKTVAGKVKNFIVGTGYFL